MFQRIMVPVDLSHTDKLQAALKSAADIAKLYGATCIYVGVSASAPSSLAHNPSEYAAKLAEFADQQAKAHGIATESHAAISHDPAVDLDGTLLKAEAATRADLVVMATHVPGMADIFLPNHGGHLAAHSKVSVFLVRSS